MLGGGLFGSGDGLSGELYKVRDAGWWPVSRNDFALTRRYSQSSAIQIYCDVLARVMRYYQGFVSQYNLCITTGKQYKDVVKWAC